MASGSPRDAVLRGITAVATMAFLLGMFLIIGVQKSAQNDPLYIFAFLLLPGFVCAAVLNVRRMLKAVP